MTTELWPGAAERTKKFLRELGLDKVNSDRLRSIWEADVTISASVASIISDWATDPSQMRLDIAQDTELEAYHRLLRYTRQKDTNFVDDVSRRFQLCVLFTFYRRFEEREGGRTSRRAFASKLVAFINDEEEVRVIENVQKWVSELFDSKPSFAFVMFVT